MISMTNRSDICKKMADLMFWVRGIVTFALVVVKSVELLFPLLLVTNAPAAPTLVKLLPLLQLARPLLPLPLPPIMPALACVAA